MSSRFIQKRDTSTQLILDIALELFAQNGFHQTTIRMIAEKAGISLGLLYNYFKSKEEVLQAIFRKTTQELEVVFVTASEQEQKLTLTAFIRLFFRSLKTNPHFWRLYYHLRLSSTTAPLVQEAVKPLNNLIQSMLESCLTDADISFPSLEAKLILAAMDGLTNHYLLQDNYPIDDVVHLLLLKYQR